MDPGVSLIQDLAIVLLAAAVAGALCRRIGLSVIVGYLVAGVVIGPYTPPFSFIQDQVRIQTLSQVGLVFLMFAIGLGLSLTKLARMGWATPVATFLGAFLVFDLTKVLGYAAGWSGLHTFFIAAMFMVSSSAVISKIVGELNLTHDRAGQLALGVTVIEDVVAVILLTLLTAQTGGGEARVSVMLLGMTAFVVVLVGAGLLMVPGLMRHLEARADPELQTVTVAGILFILAVAAARAGYSLALGAFLLGAIVAEIPQRAAVEKAFAGMRDLFSSVFFVAIGMMIDVKLLGQVWLWIIGLGVFAIVGRAVATGLALVICGTRPREARRAGLLLGPLGEFTFIIAQQGVAAKVLPPNYYPLAVGVSLFTVLMVPLINRHAEPILDFMERIEPRRVTRALDAYHAWLAQAQNSPTSSETWKLVRGRLAQMLIEILFVTGVMIFSGQIIAFIGEHLPATGLAPATVRYVAWGAVVLLALIPLVAIWRNVETIALILADSYGGGARGVPVGVVRGGARGVAAVLLGYWLYAIVPTDQLGAWGWLGIAAAAVLVVWFFSRRLIYWHSEWQSSVTSVLAGDPKAAEAEAARDRRAQNLGSWDVKLGECVVPDHAGYAGQLLSQLALPQRFGCALLEIERNNFVITAIRPELRLYPGDKLLLMGQTGQLTAARKFLTQSPAATDQAVEFRGSVLETFTVPAGPRAGRSLADLGVAQLTGTRVVGIQRGGQRIIAPAGGERLEAGDSVLVAGTLAQIRGFRRWLHAAA
ncbi:MAG: cation:proton antiporter [Opitutaceae bacterium]|nr:cation:proton antiporter [Opitutaceae bacterium]